jgi:hypothetical protein
MNIKLKGLLLIAVMIGLTFLINADVLAKSTVVSSMPTLTAKLTANKRNINMALSNLSTVASLTYELTYTNNGIDEGVFGSIKKVTTKNLSRTLYLGTCSHGACTPHKKVKNIRIEARFKLKTGEAMTRVVKL